MKSVLFLVAGVSALVRTQQETVEPKDSASESNCYNAEDKGKGYRGLVENAASGRKCKLWTAQTAISGDGLGNHGYCRNPDGSKPRPWCFVLGGTEGEAQECEIRKCDPDGVYSEGYDEKKRAETLATAISATDCQCAAQLYGSTTTTKDTSVGKAFLQKDCPCKN